MKAIIIQSPLVQLNSPYPSGAYLSSFFRKEKIDCTWYDMSLSLFYEIFSKKGLSKLFSISEKNALLLSEDFFKNGDKISGRNILQFLSQKKLWIEWIDFIISVLTENKNSVSTRELSHKFIFNPHVPRGPRMINYLENLERVPNTDDARFLATMALADLVDFISVVFDKDFSLVKYAESLTINENNFESFQNKIFSPVMELFYKPLLEKTFSFIRDSEEKFLVCISSPFAGTFAASLFAGNFFKENFGEKVFVSLGGGFINTELRDTTEKLFYKFLDGISYDRGYGSYKNLIDNNFELKPTYKMTLFSEFQIIKSIEDEKYQSYENQLTSEIFPDYSDIDFSKYPRMIDDVNPMHRLWSDGAWMKAYLAHGCYWHKCAFCDVNLDYVSFYKKVQIEQLYDSLHKQSVQKSVRGIHFVDEAMPPTAMKKFALLNSSNKEKLLWWGNIRFEKTFSKDLVDFLTYGGLIGVSAGIEIATGSGLDSIHKGIELESIVSACCAFKESGVLVHAYMIFGYFGETDLDLMNSMETLRQFYSLGLIDSCFWHKFVLTRHSRIYSEWKEGNHKNLKPYESEQTGIFSKNGLHFADEEKSEKYSQGLNMALDSWMHGDSIEKDVRSWFDFNVPRPTIDKNLVEKAVNKYLSRVEREQNSKLIFEDLWWLGGEIIFSSGRLAWTFKDELEFFKLDKNDDVSLVKELCEVLNKFSPELSEDKELRNLNCEKLKELAKNKIVEKILRKLRSKGLVQVKINF